MHRGAWRAAVHVVAKSRTQLSKTLLLLVAVYHPPEDHQGALFLPPSDVYPRSFLYLFYTLIKLYYTQALSDQASSLAPN